MTKPNAIEEIMAQPIDNASSHGGIGLAQEILAALDAAGLAVVPKDSAAMDAWIKKWTFEGGIYEDAPEQPKT